MTAVAALGACNREHRPLQPEPAVETGPKGVAVSGLFPGQPSPTPTDPRAVQYDGNAFHIGQGQTYYTWFNCNGCHFNGGGGIGPPLMDDQWRYGGEMEQIYASIVQGRPNGMPAFKDKIPDQQVWQIAAYVKSMSGEADKLAAPSRGDNRMRSTPPPNNQDPQGQAGDPAPAQSGTAR
ncbi:cytochrome c [Phenylobacterium sp.]|uniref:c-type cytochrome n=1 Tax=Phenylobacterium sp. TaxID=1871053 RepID=UPI0035AFD68A